MLNGKREKLDVDEIIVHCSASGPKTTVEDIRQWHKARGFKDIGYHYVILADGQVRAGRPWNQEGAHTLNHNKSTIGICLVGGHDGKRLHKFQKEQLAALRVLIDGLMLSFGKLRVSGHRDYAKKSCPNIDIEQWMKDGTVTYLN